jgi:cell fate (sporulation/competence/biofilm development) regulator YmcA (YheA/YmcA/DUF963 family)
MDSQNLINIAIGVAGFFGGWTVNSLSRSISKIEDRISNFVAKDDYREDTKRIMDMLDKIFDKLDNKVDK